MKRLFHWILLGFAIALGDDSALPKLEDATSEPADRRMLLSQLESLHDTSSSAGNRTLPAARPPDEILWVQQEGLTRVRITRRDAPPSRELGSEIEIVRPPQADSLAAMGPTLEQELCFSLRREKSAVEGERPLLRKIALLKSPHAGKSCGRGT